MGSALPDLAVCQGIAPFCLQSLESQPFFLFFFFLLQRSWLNNLDVIATLSINMQPKAAEKASPAFECQVYLCHAVE